MTRQTVLSQKRKKRGPAPTGKGTLLGVRLQPPQLEALDAWIEKQEESDELTRPEAIRRLVEIGLSKE
jgi:DNA replication protein DnaD